MDKVAWRDYEQRAADFFRSLGMDAVVQERLNGARGTHVVDVAIRFRRFGVDHLWVVECKHWKTRVGKTEALTLQQIIADLGADRGFLLSETGFQSGAVAASRWSSVELTNLEDLASAAAEDARSERLARAAKEHSIAMRLLYDMSSLTGLERRHPATGLDVAAVIDVHADGFSLGLALQRALADAPVYDDQAGMILDPDSALENVERRTAEFKHEVRALRRLAEAATVDALTAVEGLREALDAFFGTRDSFRADPEEPAHAERVVSAMRKISDAAETIRAGGTKGSVASVGRLMQHLIDSSYALATELDAPAEALRADRIEVERLLEEI